MDKNLTVKPGVPKGSILWSIIFLIYINDLSGNLEANVKLFADDTSIFSGVSDPISTSKKLYKNLDKVGRWANKWKISCNRNPSKQAQDIMFFTEDNQTISIINSKAFEDHLDEEFTFKHHNNEKINKVNKGIGIIRKLNNILPCHALLTIYRSSVRPDLDYGNVIYGQEDNESVISRIERVQYNASLAIARAIRKTSQENLYQELGLESLRTRKKIFKAHVLFLQTNYNSKAIVSFQFDTSTLSEWNELSTEIRNSTSHQQF